MLTGVLPPEATRLRAVRPSAPISSTDTSLLPALATSRKRPSAVTFREPWEGRCASPVPRPPVANDPSGVGVPSAPRPKATISLRSASFVWTNTAGASCSLMSCSSHRGSRSTVRAEPQALHRFPRPVRRGQGNRKVAPLRCRGHTRRRERNDMRRTTMLLAVLAAALIPAAGPAQAGTASMEPQKQPVVHGFYRGRTIGYFDFGPIKL